MSALAVSNTDDIDQEGYLSHINKFHVHVSSPKKELCIPGQLNRNMTTYFEAIQETIDQSTSSDLHNQQHLVVQLSLRMQHRIPGVGGLGGVQTGLVI